MFTVGIYNVFCLGFLLTSEPKAVSHIIIQLTQYNYFSKNPFCKSFWLLAACDLFAVTVSSSASALWITDAKALLPSYIWWPHS